MNINFKPQFVCPIKTGIKVATIRRHKKPLGKIGETLHLFTGLRTQQCQKIGMAVLSHVQHIHCVIVAGSDMTICLNGKDIVKDDHKHDFAKDDGFHSYQDMMDFFYIMLARNTKHTIKDTLEIKGYRYCWRDFVEVVS